MSKRSSKYCGFGVIAALVSVGIASSLGAQKHVGYLAKIGPGPLRLHAARPLTQPLNLPPLAMSDAPESQLPMPAAQPRSDITHRAESTYSSMGLPGRFFMPSSLWAEEHYDSTASYSPEASLASTTTSAPPAETNSPPVSAPASDVLNVSPQMLVEYFRPQSQANGANTSVLVPINFAPVTPSVPQSSGATYKAP